MERCSRRCDVNSEEEEEVDADDEMGRRKEQRNTKNEGNEETEGKRQREGKSGTHTALPGEDLIVCSVCKAGAQDLEY